MSIPRIKYLGKRDQLVREGGHNSKDGYGYTKNPDDDRAPRPLTKSTLLSKVLFRR